MGRDRSLARQAVALARRSLSDSELLPRDARRTTLVAAARVAGGEAPVLYEAYIQAASGTGDDESRRMILAALGGFRASALESHALALVLSDAFSARETSPILRSALQDAITRPAALAWLEKNADAAIARAPANETGYWPFWADGACRAEDRDALARIFGPRAAAIEGGTQSLTEVLERVDICREYRELQRPSLAAFLAANTAIARQAAR
jgi:alanyl aminopeptidase